MSHVIADTIGVSPNTDKADNHSQSQSNVVPSVFHTLILPLGLSLGSPIAGLIYFILTIVAYSTKFRAKSYYVFQIVKVAGAFFAVAAAWFGLLYSMGVIGHAL
jgi:hypothetical protein